MLTRAACQGFTSVMLAAVVVLAPAPPLWADDCQDGYHEQLSGEQIAQILVAWEAVEEQRAPRYHLQEFHVSYLRAEDDSVTISFFRPNTTVATSDGVRVQYDSAYYEVVISDARAHVLPGSSR